LLQCMIHLVHCSFLAPGAVHALFLYFTRFISISHRYCHSFSAYSCLQCSKWWQTALQIWTERWSASSLCRLSLPPVCSLPCVVMATSSQSRLMLAAPPYSVEFVRHVLSVLAVPASLLALKPLTLAPIALGAASSLPAGSLSLSDKRKRSEPHSGEPHSKRLRAADGSVGAAGAGAADGEERDAMRAFAVHVLEGAERFGLREADKQVLLQFSS
jgi:hypothetical protein